jgi:hypothetical protein
VGIKDEWYRAPQAAWSRAGVQGSGFKLSPGARGPAATGGTVQFLTSRVRNQEHGFENGLVM